MILFEALRAMMGEAIRRVGGESIESKDVKEKQ